MADTAAAPTVDIDALVERQRTFFRSAATLPRAYRLGALSTLAAAIESREDAITDALKSDLGKGAFEAYTSEIALLYEEIRLARRSLRRWMRTERVSTPIVHAPGRSRIIRRPRGVSAVLSPWNYPFQLALAPVVASIAAGNCTILKPSEFAPATSRVIARMIREHFDEAYLACVEGAGALAARLTAAEVDHIFYTGSTRIGRIVMRTAAERLVPVSLELGGKSPAIVSSTARIDVAARRVMWGKVLNAGQTCVAPDYVCVHRTVLDAFLDGLSAALHAFYPKGPAGTTDYGRIVNEAHFDRLSQLMDRQADRVSAGIGGTRDRDERYIAPTVYAPVAWDDPIMEDEIFGPLLPVIVYDDFERLIETIAVRPTPLAAYMFSEDRAEIRRFERRLPFGGATINDTVVHLTNPKLPFGGSGPSGMGSYHGVAGFREFSHTAAVLRRSSRFDVPLKYPPYGDSLKLVRRLMKP